MDAKILLCTGIVQYERCNEMGTKVYRGRRFRGVGAVNVGTEGIDWAARSVPVWILDATQCIGVTQLVSDTNGIL